eukprot:14675789-Alexandrium_andersonii.AAC.1
MRVVRERRPSGVALQKPGQQLQRGNGPEHPRNWLSGALSGNGRPNLPWAVTPSAHASTHKHSPRAARKHARACAPEPHEPTRACATPRASF